VPHIHLQTTADLVENTSIPEVLEQLVAALSRVETVDPATIKAYHSLRSVWVMGEGAAPGFAHCEVAVLTGRPEALRSKIADVMFASLKDGFAQSAGGGEVRLTVEVREMDKSAYRR
jgi:5-carboxymethyl-2-hydroxymuconate isomerase